MNPTDLGASVGPTVLVALGPNRIAVPSMFFPSLAEGLRYITPLLGEPTLLTAEDLAAPNLRGISIRAAHAWYGLADRLGADEALTRAFFTSYYDGCGEVWAFVLGEAAFAAPLVSFDLD